VDYRDYYIGITYDENDAKKLIPTQASGIIEQIDPEFNKPNKK
jgi:hypothetical protein